MDNLFIFETLKDNPENIKLINNTLQDIKRSLYEETYKAQRALCDIYRTNIEFSSFRSARFNRIVFDVNYTYIEHKERKTFRDSKYYKREVHSTEIFKNPDIFSKAILVFIDGKMTNNFYVYFNEDKIELRFARYTKVDNNSIIDDGFSTSLIEDMEKRNSIITVIIMPICKKSTAQTPFMRIYGSNYAISEYAGYWMGLSHKNVGDIPMLFMSIHDDTTKDSGAMYDSVNYEMEDHTMYILPETYPVEDNIRNPTVYLSMLYPANVLSMVNVDSDGWFETPLMGMPVPIENMIVFRKLSSSGDKMELDLYANIESYYPNKYRITSNHVDGFVVYVCYNSDFDHFEGTHDNELNLYMRYINSLNKYKDGTVEEYIRDYKPVDMEYDIPDYHTTDEEPLEYKIRKLREVIEQNPKLYSYYLKRYVEHYPNVFTETSIADKADRMRRDTSRELPNMPVHTFDDMRYLLVMRKENNSQMFKVYIDNLAIHMIDEWVFEDDLYKYYYIPMKYINNFIEVEKFIDTRMNKTHTVNTSIASPIIIDPIYHARPVDIYVTHATDNGEEYVTNYKLYEKISPDRDIEDTDINIDGVTYRVAVPYHKYQELFIVWDDETLNGETVNIRTDKYYIPIDEIDETAKYYLDSNISNDKDNFVIYRDGRLMSSLGLKIKFSEDPNSGHMLQSLVIVDDDEDINVVAEHLPYKYNLVCEYTDEYVKRLRIYQKYLDVDVDIDGREDNIYNSQIDSSIELEEAILASGHFVDLTNMLTKPLDFRWYDIYMNGLKLTERDVVFISPYQMVITLQDDYPDIDTFIMIDLLGFIEDYVIPLPFINPDIQQVTDEMIADYPEVMDENTNVVFDSDTIYSMPGSALLNPDVADGFEIFDAHTSEGG